MSVNWRFFALSVAAVAAVSAIVIVPRHVRSEPAAVSRTVRAQAALHCLDVARNDRSPHSGMVWVPAGAFQMGDTVYPEEGPAVAARVRGFWMDSHEVTNGEFAAFVKATGYITEAERPVDRRAHPDMPPDMLKPGAAVFVVPKHVDGYENIAQWWRYTPGANWRHPAGPGSSTKGREKIPVVEVTEQDAKEYARWKGHTLPTEAEWEWAARAGNPKAGLDHDQPKSANTWQGVFPVLNSGADGFVGLAPAGCYPPNAFGLYDMIGNVWEWTSDPYLPHPAESVGDPDAIPASYRGDRRSSQYVIKGGSFLCSPNYCLRYRSGSRQGQEADLAASHLGFRTILRPPRD